MRQNPQQCKRAWAISHRCVITTGTNRRGGMLFAGSGARRLLRHSGAGRCAPVSSPSRPPWSAKGDAGARRSSAGPGLCRACGCL